MGEESNLRKLPVRIRYFLLEWKDENMFEYINKYGEVKLHELTAEQLKALYIYATKKDIESWKL